MLANRIIIQQVSPMHVWHLEWFPVYTFGLLGDA